MGNHLACEVGTPPALYPTACRRPALWVAKRRRQATPRFNQFIITEEAKSTRSQLLSVGDRAHPPTTLSRVDKPLVVVNELEQRPLELWWGLPPFAKRDSPPNHPEAANDFCAVAIRVLGHGEWAVRSCRDLGKLDEIPDEWLLWGGESLSSAVRGTRGSLPREAWRGLCLVRSGAVLSAGL